MTVSRRRRRQLAEITALLEGGRHDRARGLALEHLAEFPEDAESLGTLVSPG